MSFVALALAMILAGEGAGPARTARPLRHPECIHRLESTGAIETRYPDRSYGTRETVTLLEQAIASVQRAFRGTPQLRVGDLSARGGGRIYPHRSHRDGRDADVAYYRTGPPPAAWFGRTTPTNLDVARQWALFEALLATGKVEFLFVSLPLQKALYEHAKARGLSEARLAEIFQYPRRYTERVGVIRWEPGHDTHFHVRFRGTEPAMTSNAR